MIRNLVFTSLVAAGLTACSPDAPSTAPVEVTQMAPAMKTGIITTPSANSVNVTIDRMEAAIKSKGLHVFARINHYQNAKDMGLDMRPNTVLIFGSPKIGAPIMSESPTIGLDVPVKALAWQDKDGNVFLSYNDPAYLKERHGIEKAVMPLSKMAKALAGLSAHATSE